MKHLTLATNDGQHLNWHINDMFISNRLILMLYGLVIHFCTSINGFICLNSCSIFFFFGIITHAPDGFGSSTLPLPSPSTLLFQGEEVPFEVGTIGDFI